MVQAAVTLDMAHKSNAKCEDLVPANAAMLTKSPLQQLTVQIELVSPMLQDLLKAIVSSAFPHVAVQNSAFLRC